MCGLTKAISDLARAVREATGQQSTNAILLRLAQMEERIMSKISDYATAVNQSYDGIEAALGVVQTSLGGVSDDVAYLKEVIDQLNNNPGPITPEDQALLDAGAARAAALATRVEGVKTALEQLDAATTRPEPPPA